MTKLDATNPSDTPADASKAEHTAKPGFGEVISLLTPLATIIAAIAAVASLRGRPQEITVITLAFLAPISLLVLAAKRRKRGWPILGPLLISALVGTLTIMSFGWWHANQQAHSEAKPGSPGDRTGVGRQHSTPAVNLRFVHPQQGDIVQQCPTIDGTGTIPVGYGLWIVVVPDTTMRPSPYWIEAQARPDRPDSWQAAESVSIDGPLVKKPIRASIYGILIDEQWSHYLAMSSATGSLSATSLPPTVLNGVIGPVHVVRLGGSGTCH
jgi:hypothetical protein